MKTKKMTCLLSLVVAMAGSASIMAVLNTKNNLGRAAATGGTETVSIYFGTKTGSNSTIGSNTSSSTYYTVTDNGTGFAISSLSGITAAYRTKNSEYALRLGSTYYAGAVTFNFNASYVVTAAAITTMTYGSDTSCGGSFTMSNGVKDTFTVTNATAPSVSATTDTTTGLINVTGLDNGDGTASNSFTIASTAKKKRFYVYKITLTLATSTGGETSSSSSQESSSEESSSSSSSSSSTHVSTAALTLGQSSLALYADGGDNNSTSVIASGFDYSVSYSVATTNSYVATGKVSNGLLVVTPVGTGTAALTVTAKDGVDTTTATLNVTVQAAATLTLSKTSLALDEAGTATITLSRSGFMATPTTSVATSDSTVATASLSGTTITVTALKAGTATITARAVEGSYAKTATCDVTVTAATVTPTEDVTYKLVTSTSDLVAGNSYVIASSATAGSAYFLGNSVKTGHTSYQSAVAGTIASDLTITPTTDTEIFTLGGSTGAWTFTTTNRTDNGYLYAKSYYSLLVATSTSNYYEWSISFSGNIAQIKNNGLSKYIEYYSSYSDFDVDSSAAAYLYMKTTTGGTVTPTPTVDPTLTLSKSALNLTAGGSTGTVTATTSDFTGSVTLTAKSNATNYATVAVSGTSIIVTPVAAGSATITVTATDGTHTLTKTITVTVAAAASTTGDAWTVMIYMCGADLESTSTNRLATGDLTEIKNVTGQPDNVNVIVEAGGAKSWASTYSSVISTSYLNRFHMKNNAYVKDAQITKANMGLASTFQSFLEWGLTNYPAERTMVVMWDHGGGMNGCCYDENYSNDCLLNSEVHSALAGAFASTGRTNKLEVIGYDACLMQVQDVAEFDSTYFNYMIASEESEAGYGWDYDGGWLAKIYANPTTVATSTVLTSVADTFITDNGGTSSTSNDQTMSWLDLSKVAAYKTAWENMASYLKSSVLSSSNKSSFVSLVKGCKYYAGTDYTYFCTFDAYDFMTKLVASSTFNTGSVSTYVSSVKTAFANLVQYSTCGKGAGNSHGLCMFFAVSSNVDSSTSYASSETNFTNWRSINSTYGA